MGIPERQRGQAGRERVRSPVPPPRERLRQPSPLPPELWEPDTMSVYSSGTVGKAL
jgi:hypothetical protein